MTKLYAYNPYNKALTFFEMLRTFDPNHHFGRKWWKKSVLSSVPHYVDQVLGVATMLYENRRATRPSPVITLSAWLANKVAMPFNDHPFKDVSSLSRYQHCTNPQISKRSGWLKIKALFEGKKNANVQEGRQKEVSNKRMADVARAAMLPLLGIPSELPAWNFHHLWQSITRLTSDSIECCSNMLEIQKQKQTT